MNTSLFVSNIHRNPRLQGEGHFCKKFRSSFCKVSCCEALED